MSRAEHQPRSLGRPEADPIAVRDSHSVCAHAFPMLESGDDEAIYKCVTEAPFLEARSMQLDGFPASSPLRLHDFCDLKVTFSI